MEKITVVCWTLDDTAVDKCSLAAAAPLSAGKTPAPQNNHRRLSR